MSILMPKKTLALISGLVVVTIILFIIALRAGNQSQAPSTPQVAVQPTPMVPAHTVLMSGPNPLTVVPGELGKVNITMNTSDNNVTAVQLELGYDPNIITDVKVTSGTMFPNPVVLIDKNNASTGRYTYAFGITPNSPTVNGTGVVATVTFMTLPGAAGKDMQLGLLPTSLVTARGVAQSVLKSASGTVITVGNSSSSTGTNTGITTGYNVPATAK
jgi:hypothetical protein